MGYRHTEWVREQRIPGVERSVLFAIADRLDNTNSWRMGLRDISAGSGRSQRLVMQAIRRFETLGILAVERGGPHSAGSTYTLKMDRPIVWPEEWKRSRKNTQRATEEAQRFTHAAVRHLRHLRPSEKDKLSLPALAAGAANEELGEESPPPSDHADLHSQYDESHPESPSPSDSADQSYQDKQPARAVRAADGPCDETGRPTKHRAESDEHFPARLAAWKPPAADVAGSDDDWARAEGIVERLARTATASELEQLYRELKAEPEIARWAETLRAQSPAVIDWVNRQLWEQRRELEWPTEPMRRHADGLCVDWERVAAQIQDEWGERPRGDAGKKWDRRFYSFCAAAVKHEHPWTV